MHAEPGETGGAKPSLDKYNCSFDFLSIYLDVLPTHPVVLGITCRIQLFG